ncbi:MAG: DNA repair protein RecN [Candidatus Cloacimonetes bacterium]|jgi:DNA repair protein RecN (Recombination protein N)|nr:DNA repair protein RecN [Candidatus Cloacimonadota bacterium]
MIKSLSVENFIIVENLILEFENGLQVLTGETGAGKSIIVGAISLILGSDIHTGMLLDDSLPAKLEAVFDIDNDNKQLIELLKNNDIDLSEGEVFFAKEIGTNLRSKSYINGRRVSKDIIKKFQNVLIDFHSQRDQQKLFDTDFQLEVLDIYGKLTKIKELFTSKYQEIDSKIKKMKKLQKTESELAEKIKLYQYQIDEIEKIEPVIGEDTKLQAEMNLLTNAEDILNISSQLEQVIYEKENSVYDTISSYISQLAKFKDDNKKIEEAVNFLQDASADLDNSINSIREVQNIIEVDSTRLEYIQGRLSLLNSLSVKYKRDIAGILEYRNSIQQQIESYSSGKEEISELNDEIIAELININSLAEELSAKRKNAAINFEKEIVNNIKKLAIPDAKIEFKFTDLENSMGTSERLSGLNETGKDAVDIYFSANKGVKLQPFRIAASGGELSRFLLAIKKILSDRLDRRTIIFDEIDSGIGGKTSELLAEFIHDIGKYHQVLCISHLPQIASYSDRHFSIEKISGSRNSEVIVKILDENERKVEIARMLSGSETELALQHAAELINKKLRSANV